MATITSAQSGDWSATATWIGGIVPVNGDTVIISAEHEIIFDVNQTGFANGLASLVINGKLFFKEDVVTYLKMNGNITGTGELWVGTEENPIQRPAVGSENRCTLFFNATGTINVPTIRMYGWYPDKEYTQLDADVDAGTNTIVLKEDLGLQEGDKIGIGSGTEYGIMAETVKGLYAVQSYNNETKTVVLTSNLQTIRLEEDIVCIMSRPIIITRSTGNTGLIRNTSNGVCRGVMVENMPLVDSAVVTDMVTGWLMEHCSTKRYLIRYSKNNTIRHCTALTSNYGISFLNQGSSITNCVSIGGFLNCYGVGSIIEDCVIQSSHNINVSMGTKYKNCLFKNMEYFGTNYLVEMVNCTYDGKSDFKNYLLIGDIYAQNCHFKGSNEVLKSVRGKIYNSLMDMEIEYHYNELYPENFNLESFNHNRLKGNYKAWCKGGRIEIEDIQFNKLKFICESDEHPVFRDYQLISPANRTIKLQAKAVKTFTDGTVKLQVIDPFNDPLIDSSAEPLAEKTLSNNSDRIELKYRSSRTQNIIFRIYCQSSSGHVILSNIIFVDPVLRQKLEL